MSAKLKASPLINITFRVLHNLDNNFPSLIILIVIFTSFSVVKHIYLLGKMIEPVLRWYLYCLDFRTIHCHSAVRITFLQGTEAPILEPSYKKLATLCTVMHLNTDSYFIIKIKNSIHKRDQTQNLVLSSSSAVRV